MPAKNAALDTKRPASNPFFMTATEKRQIKQQQAAERRAQEEVTAEQQRKQQEEQRAKRAQVRRHAASSFVLHALFVIWKLVHFYTGLSCSR